MRKPVKIVNPGNIIPGLLSIALIIFIWTVILAEIAIADIFLRLLLIFPSKANKKRKFEKGLVSITIANWNSKEYIVDCLRSIKQQNYPHIEVVIVDNDSSDNSMECLSTYLEKNNINARIMKNNKNLGFSKAHNQAIKIAKGEYVLTLNFDVFLAETFIERMVAEMRRDKRIGVSSGKIFNNEKNGDESVFDTTGVELRNLFCCDRGQGEADKGQYDKKEFVFGASGCASFYRREMLEDISFNCEYFDETFNTYVEDVDLSWRALTRGWKCLYNPNATAFHHRGVTRKGHDQARKTIYKNYFIQGFRNRYLMILKNLSTVGLIKKFRFIIWGEFKFWSIVFSTKRHFYAGFLPGFVLLSPRILFKRVYVLKGRNCKEEELEPYFHWTV